VMGRLGRDDRGTALIEWALVMPVLLLLLAVFFGTGRLWSTESSLLAVAKEAARAAVEARDAPSAAQAAVQVGQDRAAGYGLDPAKLQIDPVGPFVTGQPGATYRVVVHYDVDLANLPSFGVLDSHKVLTASFAEPIDPMASR
jgi:Flp pilus assembly protein TadG